MMNAKCWTKNFGCVLTAGPNDNNPEYFTSEIVSSRTVTPGEQLTTTASGHMTLRSPPMCSESITVGIKS